MDRVSGRLAALLRAPRGSHGPGMKRAYTYPVPVTCRALCCTPPHIHSPQPCYRLDAHQSPLLQMRKRRLRAANCPSQRDTAHRQLWTGQLNPRAFPFGHRATYPSPGPWLGALPTPGLTPASSPDTTLPPSMLCSNQTGLITASLTKREVGVCTASVHTPHPLVPEYNY